MVFIAPISRQILKYFAETNMFRQHIRITFWTIQLSETIWKCKGKPTKITTESKAHPSVGWAPFPGVSYSPWQGPVGVAIGVDAKQVEEEDVLILLQNVLQAGVGPRRLEKCLAEGKDYRGFMWLLTINIICLWFFLVIYWFFVCWCSLQ